MKTFLCALFAIALAGSAFADLSITQSITQEGQSDGDMELTMKIKGEKIRVDTGDKASAIMDTNTGDAQTLMHDRKMVMTLSGEMMKSMQQMAQNAAKADVPEEAPKPTGRKETISGFACEEYETTANGMKIQIWLTKELPEAEKALSQMATLSPRANIYKGMAENPEVSGFPMRSVIVSPDGKTTTVTVVALTEDPIPDSEFTAPDDYQPMQMPTMPGQ